LPFTSRIDSRESASAIRAAFTAAARGMPSLQPAAPPEGDAARCLYSAGRRPRRLPARRKRTGGLGLIEHDVLPRVILEDQNLRDCQQQGGKQGN